MKLTINEIADLKEGRKTLDEITKTHDGTSMGKINYWINRFSRDYRLDEYQGVQIVNEDNRNILTGQYVGEKGKVTRHKNIKDLPPNSHMIKNVGLPNDPNGTGEHSDREYGLFAGKPADYDPDQSFTPFKDKDMKEFNTKNDDGEYIFRSTTLISRGGMTMSLLRNNNFSADDEKQFNKVCKELSKEIPNSIYDVDESTTLYDILSKKNFENKFKDCNVRFVMRKQ